MTITIENFTLVFGNEFCIHSAIRIFIGTVNAIFMAK